ncbi:hypothetical protein RvY_07913-1 [Ramazzottius varieornatus]|uniref:SLC26A/SulP transporter domain-containing protein n=1 Tax=Ramazzottius varieornatus TaxID=947166 RepID=A0A1D1V3Y3_RAMVA|nr:hypothetical protein RvY_07913-1 [Ramazzottius varieornatus]
MFHPSDSRVALVGDNFKPGSGVHNPAFHDAEAPPNYHWVLEDEKTRTSETGGDLSWRKIRDALRNGCCTRTAWRRRLPISYWLPKYSWLDFRGDMVAGLTVGLTVVPQGLAYAQIARVPLEYGLYSAFMGCFAYTVFGTAKDITLGPTAVLSLMTGASFPKSASESDRAHYAILLSFFVGIVQLILAVFNLGFLVDFISAPVISGFTTASAFLILYAQIKTLTGLSFSADNLIDHTEGYIRTIKSVNGWDTLMGIICFTVLLLMKDLKLGKKPKWSIPKRRWNILREVVRTICVTRYALIIVVATGIGYYVTEKGYKGLSIVNTVKGGIPTMAPPQLTWDNRTVIDHFKVVGSHIPMIVLVGALESIAVAKAFAFQFQYRIEPTQELWALGLSNVLCSFFHGYPVTGSFTRSALKAQSGVRTPMGCTWTGAFVLLALGVMSPAFKYVPKAALSAVIMAAILILFEFKIFRDLWLINKKELLSIGVTIIVSFTTSVDIGILSGIGVSMLLLLWPIARPSIIANFKESTYSSHPQNPVRGKRVIHTDVTPQGAIYFPAAEYLRDFFRDEIIDRDYNEMSVTISKPGNDETALDIAEINEEIVFNGLHLTQSDYTTLRALRATVMNCAKANKKITFINTDPRVLRIVLPKEMRSKASKENEEVGLEISTIVLSESTAERLASVSRKSVDFQSYGGEKSLVSDDTFAEEILDVQQKQPME